MGARGERLTPGRPIKPPSPSTPGPPLGPGGPVGPCPPRYPMGPGGPCSPIEPLGLRKTATKPALGAGASRERVTRRGWRGGARRGSQGISPRNAHDAWRARRTARSGHARDACSPHVLSLAAARASPQRACVRVGRCWIRSVENSRPGGHRQVQGVLAHPLDPAVRASVRLARCVRRFPRCAAPAPPSWTAIPR